MNDTWRAWLAEQRAVSTMTVGRKSLQFLSPWGMSRDGMEYGRLDRRFFRYIGVLIKKAAREVTGWNQPLTEELGGDGAVLLLIGPGDEVLLSAKAEPGNIHAPGMMYLATTLQASWENIEKAHGGKAPPSVTFATDPRVLWVRGPKDGGRYYGNFNRLGLLHLDAEEVQRLCLEPNQRWFSLYELAEAYMDGECNSHLREAYGHLHADLLLRG